MEKLELHFFHGFWGLPSDWDQVAEELSFSPQRDVEVIKHNLWEDLAQINPVNFETWAQYKNANFSDRSIRKIAIGYSLGGRLLMNANLAEFDKALFISAHPGLRILGQKHQRLSHDLEWSARFLSMDWAILKNLWNTQEVFASDRVRPERKEKDFDREKLSMALQSFSLSQQKTKDEYLSTLKGKIYWAFGESDSKFSQLESRISSLIGEKYVFSIKGAGHGCLFDQPKEISNLINRELLNEENLPLAFGFSL